MNYIFEDLDDCTYFDELYHAHDVLDEAVVKLADEWISKGMITEAQKEKILDEFRCDRINLLNCVFGEG